MKLGGGMFEIVEKETWQLKLVNITFIKKVTLRD